MLKKTTHDIMKCNFEMLLKHQQLKFVVSYAIHTVTGLVHNLLLLTFLTTNQ